MEKSACNPNFALDIYMGEKTISEEELKKIVEKESPEIQIDFRKNGYITSKKYFFVTYANFHGTQKCALNYPEEKKTQEEIQLSKQNLDYMQEYFTTHAGLIGELKFVARRSNECILIAADSIRKIEEIWEKEF